MRGLERTRGSAPCSSRAAAQHRACPQQALHPDLSQAVHHHHLSHHQMRPHRSSGVQCSAAGPSHGQPIAGGSSIGRQGRAVPGRALRQRVEATLVGPDPRWTVQQQQPKAGSSLSNGNGVRIGAPAAPAAPQLQGRDVEEAAMWRCIELHQRLPGGVPMPHSRWNAKALEEAYARCGEVTAEYAKTFFLGTRLMSPVQANATWAIYVWCRRTDELVDGPNASKITPQALDRWEERLEALFDGRPYDVLDAALTDTINKFPLDIQPFRDMIEGMRMDMYKSRYQTFDELYEYCYRVAGTVGLMTMPVMGIDPTFKGPMDVVYRAALALGTANQLTNILRDVGEDARERNRIYLPLDELARFGITEQEVLSGLHVPSQGKVDERWRQFMKFQIARAREFFAEAEAGVNYLEAKARWPVWSALILYRQILDVIEANDYDNFSRRAYVSKAKKFASLPLAFARAVMPIAYTGAVAGSSAAPSSTSATPAASSSK